MKYLILFLALSHFASASVDINHMVDVLHELEHIPGKPNEWQLNLSTWQQFTKNPLVGAPIWMQRQVAFVYVDWIVKRLCLLHLDQTPQNIALVWAAGYGNVERGHITGVKRDYAKRASYLYYATQN